MNNPEQFLGKDIMTYFAGLERNRSRSAGLIENRKTFNPDQESKGGMSNMRICQFDTTAVSLRGR